MDGRVAICRLSAQLSAEKVKFSVSCTVRSYQTTDLLNLLSRAGMCDSCLLLTVHIQQSTMTVRYGTISEKGNTYLKLAI